MKRCLDDIVSLRELRDTYIRDNNGCIILDLSDGAEADKFFLNFDPSTCHKRIKKIKTSDEDKILFIMNSYIAKTRKNIITNHDKFDNKNSDIVIDDKLLNNIKFATKINYNDDLIIKFLKKQFIVEQVPSPNKDIAIDDDSK